MDKVSASHETPAISMLAKVRRVEAAITWTLEAFSVFVLALMVVVVFASVVARYVFVDPLIWADESSRIMLVYLAFIGATLAVREGSHYTILFILNKFPPRAHRIAVYFIALVMAGFMLIMVRMGSNLTIMAHAQISPVLQFRISWMYAVIPIGGALMLFYLLLDMADLAATGKARLGVDPTAHLAELEQESGQSLA